MTTEENADVLIVGAGPVGLTAALALAEQGVKATVIDAGVGTAAHSYACALHPRSLEWLERFGLLDEALEWGRRINSLAFYDGAAKRAEVRFAELPVKFPFVLALPQNALEWLLERTLHRRAGIEVRWRHRLTDVQVGEEHVAATVQELGDAGPGAAPPVQRTSQVRASILIGADGHNSQVRRSLGIATEQLGAPALFALFEFETHATSDDTARVVLDDSSTSVLWPMSDVRCRWSFQLPHLQVREEFPEKERASGVGDPAADPHQAAQDMRQLLRTRAPWFARGVDKVEWTKRVPFHRRLSERFASGRCWLLGDAAHQTGPVGVQSLNAGLSEAIELAAALIHADLGNAPGAGSKPDWNERWRQEWQTLLGLKGAPLSGDATDDWVKRQAGRILPCLPASGAELTALLAQLRLRRPE